MISWTSWACGVIIPPESGHGPTVPNIMQSMILSGKAGEKPPQANAKGSRRLWRSIQQSSKSALAKLRSGTSH